MLDWVADQRQLWHGQSVWSTAVYANIANADVSNGYVLLLDTVKKDEINALTFEMASWANAVLYVETEITAPGNNCDDSGASPKSVPPTAKDKIDECPKVLQRASFKFSFEIFSMSINCEQVKVGLSAPLLGPFGSLTVTRTGDLTVMVGVKAGDNFGPAGVGVQAGGYVTLSNGEISDVGVTVSAGASVTAGTLNLSAPPLSATVNMADTSPAAVTLVQPPN